MSDYYNRYAAFVENGEVMSKIPYINITESQSDIYITYDKNRMRLDSLSYKYYGNPDYAWLILQANPSYGGFEYSIPNGVKLRIPYPIDTAIQRYEIGISKWRKEKNRN